MTPSAAALLRAHDLKPNKKLGQNFLVDAAALGRIVAAADLGPDDVVIEVGAGLGTLTEPLAQAAGRVIAVEFDRGMVQILREQFGDRPNVEIVQGDILRIPNPGLGYPRFKVVANLPYYITSAVLRHFLEQEPRPHLMVVTVQQEVAERIVAGPGDMSLLAVSVQFYGEPSLVARIPAGAFYPPPKVSSAVVRIAIPGAPRAPLPPGLDDVGFFRVVRAGFSQKRKTLRNSLSAGLRLDPADTAQALEQAGVDPRRRAETLTLEEWARLAGALLAP